jgi:FMN phosphatase YigB (HAD superfamily)
MITWQDKKYILFGLNGTLLKQYGEQIRIAEHAEKFLFLLLNLNHLPKIHLVSNMPIDDLQCRMHKTGLNYFMHQVDSSLSTGLVKSDVKFWVNYLEVNNINPQDAVIFDNNPKVALAAVKAEIPTILLIDDMTQQNTILELEDELIKYKSNILFVTSFLELLPNHNKVMELLNA